MSGHFDDVVFELVAMVQDGATDEQIKEFLEQIDPEERGEVLEHAARLISESDMHVREEGRE